MTERRVLRAMWIGVAVQVIGGAVDLHWHATHHEFERASQQVQAHWLAWLGVGIVLVAAASALTRLTAGERRGGYQAVLIGCLLFAAVSVWHFIEHANGADPQVAHVFLYLSYFGIIAAVAWLTLTARRSAARSRASLG